MTEILCSPKIKPEHLARKAIVYLRQSSDKQVRQNLESQRLQYEVAERIRSLGWRHVEMVRATTAISNHLCLVDDDHPDLRQDMWEGQGNGGEFLIGQEADVELAPQQWRDV